ncbi:MAG: class I SAM-dependent methyltransferase [Myxococcales bacterium]|nr:class I SAM-dependent methyltransferase [Myxococcales bacterium]
MAEQLTVYMGPSEQATLRAALHLVAPRRLLESGAGGSTRFFLSAVPELERLVSIEHDGEWAAKVRADIRDPRLDLHHVPADIPPTAAEQRDRKKRQAWDARAEHDPAILRSYVERPRSLGIEFDVILVDGRARRYCLAEGYSLLRAGGLMILHDAQRVDYHDAIPGGARVAFIEPWEQGQVCLIVKPG